MPDDKTIKSIIPDMSEFDVSGNRMAIWSKNSRSGFIQSLSRNIQYGAG